MAWGKNRDAAVWRFAVDDLYVYYFRPISSTSIEDHTVPVLVLVLVLVLGPIRRGTTSASAFGRRNKDNHEHTLVYPRYCFMGRPYLRPMYGLRERTDDRFVRIDRLRPTALVPRIQLPLEVHLGLRRVQQCRPEPPPCDDEQKNTELPFGRESELCVRMSPERFKTSWTYPPFLFTVCVCGIFKNCVSPSNEID